MGNPPWLPQMQRRVATTPQSRNKRQKLTESKTKFVKGKKVKQIQGNADLSMSEHYCQGFAAAVTNLHSEHLHKSSGPD
eukprot:4704535-Lingulodinium_polyedra.AAC.1